MSITTVPAGLDSQRELIVETLSRYLAGRSDDRWFDWLYALSPYGQARTWLAIDNDRGAVIGVAAAFPRRFHLGNKEILGWVLGDFCLDPDIGAWGRLCSCSGFV